jgi:hypothetical protein
MAADCVLVDLISPNTVTVRLVNDGDFAVETEARISDEQLILEDVLEETGEQITNTVGAGQVVTFTRPCDELQAIMVSGDLQLVGEIGPSQKTDVKRDSEDFNCGDTIVFTFDHPDVPASMSIDFESVSQ